MGCPHIRPYARLRPHWALTLGAGRMRMPGIHAFDFSPRVAFRGAMRYITGTSSAGLTSEYP